MNSTKAEMSIRMIVLAVIVVLILIAFVPIFVSTIFETQFTDATMKFTNETHTFTNATPLGLANSPLIASVANDTIFIVWNATDGGRINASNEADTGWEILFTDNATVTFHGVSTSNVSFNYTVTQQNSTGLSTASIALLSLVVLIFVASIVIVVVKKFLK